MGGEFLMLGQNGFGDNCSETPGLARRIPVVMMDDENEQIAHNSSYSGQNPLQFRAKLEFARNRFVEHLSIDDEVQ